jgi:hypothetical protein
VRRMVSRNCLSALLALAFASLAACSDTGDSSSPIVTNTCAAPDASVVTDSGSETVDSGRVSLGNTEDGSVDGAIADGALAETSSGADGTADAEGGSQGDASHEGGSDAGLDAHVDSGTHDATVPDSGEVDSAVADSGTPEASAATGDGGDTSVDPNTICNAATGKTTGCSGTELAFVEHDPTGVCVNCLVQGGALDDLIFPDTGHECEDLGGAAEAACLATLDCILNTNVGGDNVGDTTLPTAPTCAPKGDVSDCYCGIGTDTGACAALTSAPTGPCTDVEAAGLDLPTFPTTPVLNAYTNVTLGSGVANQIFVTAQSNTCTTCF